jgi:hypothetical protein
MFHHFDLAGMTLDLIPDTVCVKYVLNWLRKLESTSENWSCVKPDGIVYVKVTHEQWITLRQIVSVYADAACVAL